MTEQLDTGSSGLLRRRHAPDGVILALACVAQFMVILDRTGHLSTRDSATTFRPGIM
jgi:hypothetical protein